LQNFADALDLLRTLEAEFNYTYNISTKPEGDTFGSGGRWQDYPIVIDHKTRVNYTQNFKPNLADYLPLINKLRGLINQVSELAVNWKVEVNDITKSTKTNTEKTELLEAMYLGISMSM
jgi:hypothetical protein